MLNRHWFYEDWIRPVVRDPSKFPSLNLKGFYDLLLKNQFMSQVSSTFPLTCTPLALPPSLLKRRRLKSGPLIKKSFSHTQIVSHPEAVWTEFMAYKVRVPVCGAILISKDWNKARPSPLALVWIP